MTQRCPHCGNTPFGIGRCECPPELDYPDVIKNALDNYAHGRRVFALQQLEALVGHTSDASEIARGNDEFYTNRCLKRKGHR